MAHDTRELNRRQDHFTGRSDIWLFGYGSLIHKVDFPFLEARDARIQGWARRFWQGSHDHRGTPEAPGRVLTLVEAPDETCVGVAYRVTPDVFEHLDHREKNGYLRLTIDMTFIRPPHQGRHANGLIYIAGPNNAAWLGPASEAAIARQIARSQGPSGRNDDYVLKLDAALQDMGAEDPHVAAIARHLRASDSSHAHPSADREY
ncbi:gamma-glutamylcyclotransferase [Natronospirillum operosum]|uniref:glutathione-specific gamma-glutamylcyclotransferase n=1 Tax=Natronospirillum operosum TaxID=2759953 RepID=A0A4Z0W8E6_9GAMM|nr:gamma-glutamylcyclotransferase [Natronospirillum operosum]TGG93219.1 gamma-glutamylcyclotransferase [Natronospirillum operosum]